MISFASCWARQLLRTLLAILLLACAAARAEPYLAIQTGAKCSACHVNPTGSGLRSEFGDTFSQYQMPMTHADAGTDNWTGDLNRFLRIGGDLRYDFTYTHVPNTPDVDAFQLQQTRLYLEATVIPDRLMFYVDEQVAPGGALNREAYALLWSKSHEWYIKAGQMYLPFGFRLQDQTAFVLTESGINMTTPDQGVEVGYLRGPWDIQIAASNGSAGGPANGEGKQYTANLAFVQPFYRVGVAASENDSGGMHQHTYGAFAGLHTGPVVWLGEVDMVDAPATLATLAALPIARTRSVAELLEADISVFRGNNLKLTFEHMDPNKDIGNDGQSRWSVVYELTPVQFLQLRAGVRKSEGIPQANIQNTLLTFVELHGFF